MEGEELSTYEGMPDYVDIKKEQPAVSTEEPSDTTAPDTDGQPADDSAVTQEPESENDQPAEEQPAEEASEQPEEKYLVKVGDKEEEVSLDELKQSYMRTADYTRKTTELAEQRKALQAKSEARDQELTRLKDLLTDAETKLLAELQDSEARELRKALSEINVSTLNDADLSQYMKAKAHCEQLEAKEQAKIAKFEHARKQYLAEQEKLENEQFEQDQKALMEELPDFKDPVKRERLNQDISSYLVTVYGDKKARQMAPTIRSKADYMTLYYATIGKKLLETKTPSKVAPVGKPISAKNQAGAQTVSASNKKQQDALLSRIKANGARGEASEADIIQYLMKG